MSACTASRRTLCSKRRYILPQVRFFLLRPVSSQTDSSLLKVWLRKIRKRLHKRPYFTMAGSAVAALLGPGCAMWDKNMTGAEDYASHFCNPLHNSGYVPEEKGSKALF